MKMDSEILRKMKPSQCPCPQDNVLSVGEAEIAMNWIKSFTKYNYSERLLIKPMFPFRGLVEVDVSVNDEVYHFFYRTCKNKFK